MNKKILSLSIIVIVLGLVVFILFLMPKNGVVVFNSDPEFLPFDVKIASSDAVLEPVATCNNVECSIEVPVGSVDLYIEKEGYYAQNEFFDLKKGDEKYITVALEAMTGVAIDATAVDSAMFENCYGDSVACGQDLYLSEDADTGYIALWEGDTRRATFTKGMTDATIFMGGLTDSAIVYDKNSGDAYLVNFVTDSREFAFNIDPQSDLKGVQALDDGAYLLQIGESVFWQNYAEGREIVSGVDLTKFAYKDGYTYFVADSANIVDYISDISADGICVFKATPGNYEVVLNDIDFPLEGTVLGQDESGVYGKSGEEIWAVL